MAFQVLPQPVRLSAAQCVALVGGHRNAGRASLAGAEYPFSRYGSRARRVILKPTKQNSASAFHGTSKKLPCVSTRQNRSAMQVRAASVDATTEGALFEKIANDFAGMQDMQVELRASGVHGKGLFARKAFRKGDVMMAVPLETCLVIKRDPEDLHTNSWRAPEDGTWEQVERGFASHMTHGLPWDLVCALALMDAAMGGGGHSTENTSSSCRC
mmetsp:Transcript_4859/g.8395  ORF Transcript_4859/g.8395 Transcript_4859/m.8395 type:complete len:214 (+) Transcript_4859:110-751(+)